MAELLLVECREWLLFCGDILRVNVRRQDAVSEVDFRILCWIGAVNVKHAAVQSEAR